MAAPVVSRLGGGSGLLVRRLLLDPLRSVVLRRPWRSGRVGRFPVVRPDQGAAHGRLRGAGGNPDAALVGGAVGCGPLGCGGGDTRFFGLRVAGAGQCGNRYGGAAAPGAVHGRVWNFFRVHDDGHGAGAGFTAALAPRTAVAAALAVSGLPTADATRAAGARGGAAGTTERIRNRAVEIGRAS